MNITGGKYNSRKVKTASYENIKPTLSKTRQGIFNSLASMTDFEGKLFCDMFAGSGIMSLEALSRGFRVISFEKDKKTAAAIKDAFSSLGLKPDLYTGDALKLITLMNLKPDVIFLDPPYMSDLYDKALNVIAAGNILNKNGIIVVEHPESVTYTLPSGMHAVKIKQYSDKLITYISFETGD